MRVIQKILNILIKLIVIIWSIISLFLLSLISILIYIVFKFQDWFLKRKFRALTENCKVDNTVSNKQTKDSQDKIKVKIYENNNNPKSFSTIHTINRNLKTKDGEIL